MYSLALFRQVRLRARSRQWTCWGLTLSAILLLWLGIPAGASGQFQDIGYTFEPTIQGILDDGAAAFENDPLYGGALGLSFGRSFQVSAEYLFNTEATARLSELDRLDGVPDRSLDVRRYGPRIRINLYEQRVIPYLTAGTGILEFDPEDAEESRTIYGSVGGGVTFSAYDRYRVSVGGELFSYRYDPVATFFGPPGADDFETGTELVTSPALSASVSLFLGGRSLEEETAVDAAIREQFGGEGFLRGVGLSVNPFYGRVEFNEALGFPKDQNFTGVNAGLSFGPYVGLRGFYWRGATGSTITDRFAGGFEDIQIYGSELELRLNLNLSRGLVPYARVGGGYLDVMGGYDRDIGEGAEVPDDRFLGTAGVGLELPFTRGVKLAGGVRTLVMSNPNAVEPGDPGEIYGSLMYTGGIEFRVGGRDRAPEPDVEGPPLLGRPETEPAEPGPEPVGPPVEPVEEPERPEQQAAPMSTRERQLAARVDSLERALQVLKASRAEEVPASVAAERSNLSDRTMTVPVPETGELYIRFGELSGTAVETAPRQGAEAAETPDETEERVRRALQEELQQTLEGDTARALSRDEIEQLIQETIRETLRRPEAVPSEEREEAEEPRTAEEEAQARQIERLQRRVEMLRRELREREPTRTPPRREIRVEPASEQPFYRQSFGWPLTYIVPITGFRAGRGPDQWQIGVRGDYRLTPTTPLHFLPELSFGIGGGEPVSPTILVNGAYSFLRQRLPALLTVPLEPYAGVGLGIASEGGFTFQPVTNVMAGFDYRFPDGRTVFLEYSTLDFFDTHRVHLGTRIRL